MTQWLERICGIVGRAPRKGMPPSDSFVVQFAIGTEFYATQALDVELRVTGWKDYEKYEDIPANESVVMEILRKPADTVLWHERRPRNSLEIYPALCREILEP